MPDWEGQAHRHPLGLGGVDKFGSEWNDRSWWEADVGQGNANGFGTGKLFKMASKVLLREVFRI
jgi:hypothetical protein